MTGTTPEKPAAVQQTVTPAEIFDIYTLGGFTLFPCGNDSKDPGDGKAPLYKNWRKTQWSEDFRKRHDVYGVLLTENDAVVDYDPRNETEGNTGQLAALWNELDLPKGNTFIVKTGSGGLHIYFKIPAGTKLRAKVPGYPAIDIKTHGGYVIAAGSLTQNGKAYTIARHDPGTVAEMPTALLTLVTRAEDDLPKTSTEDDSDGAVFRFRQYAFNCPPDSTYERACEGRAYGLSAAATFNILADVFNPRRHDPRSVEDLKRVVEHAYRYGKTAQGALSVETEFKDVAPVMPPVSDNARKRKDEYEVKWEPGPRGINASTMGNCVNYFRLPKLGHQQCHLAKCKHADDSCEGNELRDLVRYNLFANKIEFTRKAQWHDYEIPPHWSDSDTLNLKLYLSHYEHFNVSTAAIHEAITVVAQMDAYHPVREYLHSLKWDGVPRLDMWLTTYAGAQDSAYVREVGKNTLIAAVARIMQPGCKHDSMLVLEGEPGTGKSSLVRVLGGQWYADVKLQVNTQSEIKETVSGMVGHWIIEASEMEFSRKMEVEAIKRFLTVTEDVARPAYERISKEFKRDSVFLGTVNRKEEQGYLHDITTIRRFWPVAIGKINLVTLAQDRDQVFAEAFQRYRQGEKWHLTDPELERQALAEAESRVETDIWSELVHDWYMAQDPIPESITAAQIAANVLNLSPAHLGFPEQRRITKAMRSAGFTNSVKKINGKSERAWRIEV
jgi:predicted P-loop ATPase